MEWNDPRTRRSVLKTGVGIGLGTTVAGCGFLNESEPDATVGAEQVASGFAAPLGLEVAPGVADTLFIVDQTGAVTAVDGEGQQSNPFLDLTDRIVGLDGYEERGLLGLAFHPDFEENRRLFVRYSAPLRASMPNGYSHTFVLSEFRAPDGLEVDPTTERLLLEIPQPQGNHNAGPVVFGPDGHLYVGVGDGGGANDVGTGHVSDWYEDNTGGNGQDVTENLLGSVLRIDVDGDETGSSGRPYAIPEANPLVGREGRDEHFAWGFRNPWGMSFTDGELYVADVGQNRYEEIDIVRKGANYGWNVREGTHCFDPSAPDSEPDNCPGTGPDGDLQDPIIEYSHSGDEPNGVSVIGGYRYTGETVDPLQNRYVFGDWQSEGEIFAASERDGDDTWPITRVGLAPTDENGPGQFLLGFGRDVDGELYVLTTDRRVPAGETGRIHRLQPVN